MAKIASRITELTGEGALAVFSRAKELEAQGRSIIHLELGEPDFHPAAPVVQAVCSAVANGRDRYVATRGIPTLRSAIADYLKRTRKVDVTSEEVLVAPGCKMALSLTMMALIESGDEHERWGTVGVSHNVIEASWQALVDSMEYKLYKDAKRRQRVPLTADGASQSKAKR